ncbi:AraC-like DNA-binding protein [Mucilaginibacter oryzae]|uniref:AraC-like DNA-binding protein n=1 Tax=Mucilaginibacter oryzae TaxID=468058 RepID=A0A316H4W4_9SPHI|nr:DUF6597 domain-containing transcriptional factor [Mucilaginibacter oryzae]PWK70866.1 AraC-like DNA-binding protein [Mucilaginibacter oryzae]
MKFQSYLPSPRLRPYVKELIISENGHAQTYKVLPGTSLVMGFQYAGKLSYINSDILINLSTAGVTGLMNSYRIFSNSAGIGSILVVFTETGASRFIRQPVHELFDQSLSLDHFFDRAELNKTEELLSIADTDSKRIYIIEQLLVAHLQESREDKLVTAAINLIHQHKGTIRIADLARNLNTSQSPLEKRFRKIVGSSPKKFSSIVRAKSVMEFLKQGSWQGALHLGDYHDQAHLIKEFKTYSGATPEQYIKELRKIR